MNDLFNIEQLEEMRVFIARIYLFQTFCIPTKCLKQLKFASTLYKMFDNVLFSFCCLNFSHSRLKRPTIDVAILLSSDDSSF